MKNTKTQIPRKHVGKKMSEAEEKIVARIKDDQHLRTTLEAKHAYFESKEKYDHEYGYEWQNAQQKKAGKSLGQQIIESTPMPRKTNLMKLNQTKLGVTIVLSLEDCQALGFTGEEMTRDVVDKVRTKLGLMTRAQLREDKKASKGE